MGTGRSRRWVKRALIKTNEIEEKTKDNRYTKHKNQKLDRGRERRDGKKDERECI